MFVLSVLEAPNTNTNSFCVQTHLAIKLFLILILIRDLFQKHNKTLIIPNFWSVVCMLKLLNDDWLQLTWAGVSKVYICSPWTL